MKGGIVVAAHAARLLAAGSRPFGLVELVSASDEETRPSAPLTMDRLEGFDAVLCLECGRADGSIVSARKGGRWFRIHATGRPAHAGVDPDGGRNAVLPLCHEALRLLELHHAREGLTFQVTELHGGHGVNTVPGRAFLTGDLRGPTADDLDWAMAQVRAFGSYPDIDLREEDLGGPPPLERTPQVAAMAAAAIGLGRGLEHDFDEAATGGVSDGSWTAWSGIPTLDGLGPVGGDDHTPFEYAELDTFAPRAGIVAGLVAAVDAGLLEVADG
jgi:glutamate carboxypeptidase